MLKNMSALGYSVAQGLVTARHRSRSGEAGGSASPQAYAGRAQAKRDGLVFAIQQCVNEARYLFCPIGTASFYPR